jgi:D-sedoheptulose 7-phosphate isomerase
MQQIKDILEASIETKKQILADEKLLNTIERISQKIIRAISDGNKILFCGNGGSAADAQHLAAELSNKFYKNRKPLDAEALHVNTSYLTACANDYAFEDIYSRLIEARGRCGDILVGLSTSGNSKNIINALKKAKEKDMVCIGFSGKDGGEMKSNCDYIIQIPSTDTARIQESHITIGHILCKIIEDTL